MYRKINKVIQERRGGWIMYNLTNQANAAFSQDIKI